MATKAASLARILQWAQELGWRATFRNLIAIALGRRDRLLSVPGVSAKIRVRANDSDLVMFEQVFVRRDYEFDLGFEPSTIVDAGANAGYASLYFHRKYPDARIIHKATNTGKYRVITTHFGGGGNLGDFTLTVRQTEGAPPLIERKDGKGEEKK